MFSILTEMEICVETNDCISAGRSQLVFGQQAAYYEGKHRLGRGPAHRLLCHHEPVGRQSAQLPDRHRR